MGNRVLPRAAFAKQASNLTMTGEVLMTFNAYPEDTLPTCCRGCGEGETNRGSSFHDGRPACVLPPVDPARRAVGGADGLALCEADLAPADGAVASFCHLAFGARLALILERAAGLGTGGGLVWPV